MRIAVTGATGFVGTALTRHLWQAGHEVIGVSRAPDACTVVWDPVRQQIDAAKLEGLGAVVHLAGENLASGRWTSAKKTLLRDSRVPVTQWLSSVLAGLRDPPAVLLSASAVGIYGDRGEEILDEESHPGHDFLARLTSDWERAADPARHAGIRVVHPRFGMILSPAGGALARMLPVFRLGLGGPLGSGEQWISWITRDDVVRGIAFVIGHNAISGAVNFVSPEPVRNAGFTRALSAALHRPAILPAPRFALRIAFGELADATLLASQRAAPRRLVEAGFSFESTAIDRALHRLINQR
ncbi:MAG TPA: TIGR01777 family oxidoreductase [Gemmatimonadales bacterium]|jgi:hypothetical protein